MLEILLLIQVYRGLGNSAAEKGRSRTWGFLGVLFWFVGELMGGIIGGMLGLGLAAYGLALVLAAVGAGVAFFVVSRLGSPNADIMDDSAAPGGGPFDPENPYSPPGAANKR